MKEAARRKPMPPLLVRFCAWTVALGLLSAAYSAVLSKVLHTPHPYGLNLIWGADRWWDFLVFKARFLQFRTPAFWTIRTYPFTYPAPLAVVFGMLYRLAHPLRDYLAACAAALLAWVLWLARGLREKGVSPGVALAFAGTVAAAALPVWFLFVTANIEGLVVFTLALGVLASLRGRWWLGSALIGAAGAMKIFPLILLGLALSRRRYREFGFGLVVGGLLTWGSLAVVGPSVHEAQTHIAEGITFVKQAFVFSLLPDDLAFNHSLFMPVKVILGRLHPVGHAAGHDAVVSPEAYLEEAARNTALLERPYKIYVGLVAAFGVAAYFGRIRKLPMLNQVLALTACALLLPPISLDYTLVHLLLPFGLLCLYIAGEPASRRPVMLLACFAILFTAGTFFTIRYRMAAPVHIVALLVMLLGAMREPLPWPELDSNVEAR